MKGVFFFKLNIFSSSKKHKTTSHQKQTFKLTGENVNDEYEDVRKRKHAADMKFFFTLQLT